MKDLLEIEFIPRTSSNDCDRFSDLPLAYSYVPYQVYEKTYSKAKGLTAGTIFPALNKPFGVYGREFYGMAGAKDI